MSLATWICSPEQNGQTASLGTPFIERTLNSDAFVKNPDTVQDTTVHDSRVPQSVLDAMHLLATIFDESSTLVLYNQQYSEPSYIDATRAKQRAICAEILSYADLSDDFDGDDGHAPAQQDIENAVSFISRIPNAGVAAVRTMVVGDGEVGFEWKEPKKYCLEISFSEGEISFFGDMPNGERLNGDAVYDENAIPEILQRLLSAIFSD